MSQLQSYQKQYLEMDLLGRGNYGSAYLVQYKINNQFYVAKKMMLQGLSESEIAAAWGQIEILKKFGDLKSPFIVAYREMFHFDNMLIIIMEYCEHGDLATFIKNKKKKDELLNQKVIVNWFIQILLGISMLHSKKVLHRDLKSANIFLTSNKTIKIGDFGISKVLDNTSAKTFVGTPYYLSPEVCENRPYDFRSDLWSLGCILFEMCTLKYPFQASNLLGLAMKILNDEVQPIPSQYPVELNEIVKLLLTKDENHRITIQQILEKPYIKKQMATFSENRGNIEKLIHIPVRKTICQSQEKKQSTAGTDLNSDSNDDTMKTIQSNFVNTGRADTMNSMNYSEMMGTMSRSEYMKLKKMQEGDRKAQEQRQAIRDNAEQRNFAKNKKLQNLGVSNTTSTGNNQLLKKIQKENQEKAELKKTQNKRLQKNQEINIQELAISLNQMKTVKAKHTDYEDVPLPVHQQKKQQQKLEQPLPSQKSYQQVPTAELRKQLEIQEEIQEELEEYYDEEFEDYEEGTLKQDKAALDDIEAIYACFAGLTLSPSKKEKVENAYKQEDIVQNSNEEKVQNLRDRSISEIGEQAFNVFYGKIRDHEFSYKDVKKNYSPGEQRAIQSIQEMIYIQETMGKKS